MTKQAKCLVIPITFVGAYIQALAKEAGMCALRKILPEIDLSNPVANN